MGRHFLVDHHDRVDEPAGAQASAFKLRGARQ